MQGISTAILHGDPPPRARGEAVAGSGAYRITVCDKFGEAASAWTGLQAVAPCSPYQQLAWAQAWADTVGAARCARPILGVAQDASGQAVALFPFVREVICGVRIARFVGGKDSNGNLALFADPASWDGPAVSAALHAIAGRAGIDLFALQNQLGTWQGQGNPLTLLPHQPTPSGVAVTTLVPDRVLSKQARKRIRQKTGWLEQIGPVELRRATTSGEIERVLEAYVAHRAARVGTAGVGPPSPAQLAFYRRAADPAQAAGADGAAMELHALWCGSEIVATFGGTGFRDRYSGMILSFAARPDLARCSPGELLLRKLMADLPRRGFASFDLGIGEARYKASICDDREPLVDGFVPITPVGRVAAMGLSAALRAKGWIKRSDVAMSLRRRVGTLARGFGSSGFSRP